MKIFRRQAMTICAGFWLALRHAIIVLPSHTEQADFDRRKQQPFPNWQRTASDGRQQCSTCSKQATVSREKAATVKLWRHWFPFLCKHLWFWQQQQARINRLLIFILRNWIGPARWRGADCSNAGNMTERAFSWQVQRWRTHSGFRWFCFRHF